MLITCPIIKDIDSGIQHSCHFIYQHIVVIRIALKIITIMEL